MRRESTYDGLLAKRRIPIDSWADSQPASYHLLAHLWSDKSCLNRFSGDSFLPSPELKEDAEWLGSSSGLCRQRPTKVLIGPHGEVGGHWRNQRPTGPCIAELHFVAGCWDAEVVAHEVIHTWLHTLRCLAPAVDDPRDTDDEERLAYRYGVLFERVSSWLLSVDPAILAESPA